MFKVVDNLRSIEFGTPGESRTRLIDFIVNGNKRATAERAGFKIARKSAEQCPDGATQTTAIDYELTFERFN